MKTIIKQKTDENKVLLSPFASMRPLFWDLVWRENQRKPAPLPEFPASEQCWQIFPDPNAGNQLIVLRSFIKIIHENSS